MTRFFCRTHAARASGPLASSTDLAVSAAAAAAAGSRLDRSGMVGGVVVIPGGARPLCAERSPWTACSARKTASLEGAVEGLGGLDLLSRGEHEDTEVEDNLRTVHVQGGENEACFGVLTIPSHELLRTRLTPRREGER